MNRLTLLFLLAAAALPAADLRKEPVPAGVTTLRDVPYIENGHERHILDLHHFPDGPPRPLIVWVHGGAWSGDTLASGVSLAPLEWGFAFASIEYRLSQHATFPAQIQDLKAAIRFLRAHAKKYNLDPDRIGAWGSSAGGHLVALLGTSGGVEDFDTGPHLDHSSRVQCVVDFFGPTDFTRITEQTPSFSKIDRSDPKAPEWRLLGGTLEQKRALALQASPVHWVSPDDPPFLILHGDRDPLVPHAQSPLLHEALRKAGVESTFITVPGVEHDRMAIWKKHRSDIRAFFEKHLKKGTPR